MLIGLGTAIWYRSTLFGVVQRPFIRMGYSQVIWGSHMHEFWDHDQMTLSLSNRIVNFGMQLQANTNAEIRFNFVVRLWMRSTRYFLVISWLFWFRIGIVCSDDRILLVLCSGLIVHNCSNRDGIIQDHLDWNNPWYGFCCNRFLFVLQLQMFHGSSNRNDLT